MVFRTNNRTATRRRGGFRWQILILFALGAAGYYFYNQKTVPYVCDGRYSQYAPDMCRKQLRTMGLEKEKQLGLQSYMQILQDEQSRNPRAIVSGGPNYDAVQRIGADIARAAQEEAAELDFDWQFNLVDSQQANAFALPGGYTAVYTGLMPIAANEDGLAVVMGHEVAHALARHGAERMAQQNIQKIVGMGVSLGTGGMGSGAQQAVMGVFGGVSQYGFALPFSRKHESEADFIGLILVARACYDPREAPKLWERMGANAGANPPEFQSTHPAPETRVQNFQEWMSMAIDIYNQSCTDKIRQ